MILRREPPVALLVLLGCGPSIAVHGQSTGSTSGGSTTRASASDTTATPPSETPGPSSSTTTGGSSTGVQCGCPDPVAVGFRDPVREGFSAADLVAQYQMRSMPFDWLAFEDSPTETTLHLELAYEGGVVMDGPGGGDACGFLQIPCDPELTVDVRIDVTTDDGRVMGSLPGQLVAALPFGAVRVALQTEPLPIAQFGGTLAETTVTMPGVLMPTEASFHWADDGVGELFCAIGGYVEEDFVLLGESFVDY